MTCAGAEKTYNWRVINARLAAALAMAAAAISATSCAPIAFVGATTAGGVVAVDNRTVGSFVEDENIEISALLDLRDSIGDAARYNVVSINRVALVVGQAPDVETRERIERTIAGVENVRSVINQIEIRPSISLAQRARDTVITTRVKAALLAIQEDDFTSLDVKVVTEDAVVYLMGLITVENAAKAIEAARKVEGVKQVVQAFEYLSPRDSG